MRRGEGKSILLDLASSACLALAVLLFANHHPALAVAAGVASFVVSGRSGQAFKDGRIDEALAAKEEWDRLRPGHRRRPLHRRLTPPRPLRATPFTQLVPVVGP